MVYVKYVCQCVFCVCSGLLSQWRIIMGGTKCIPKSEFPEEEDGPQPPGSAPPNSRLWLHPSDLSIALSASTPLYPPGRVIHVVHNHPPEMWWATLDTLDTDLQYRGSERDSQGILAEETAWKFGRGARGRRNNRWIQCRTRRTQVLWCGCSKRMHAVESCTPNMRDSNTNFYIHSVFSL